MKFDKYTVQKQKSSFLIKIVEWAQKNGRMVEKLTRQDIITAVRSKS